MEPYVIVYNCSIRGDAGDKYNIESDEGSNCDIKYQTLIIDWGDEDVGVDNVDHAKGVIMYIGNGWLLNKWEELWYDEEFFLAQNRFIIVNCVISWSMES